MTEIHNNLPPITLPFFTIIDVLIFFFFLGGVFFVAWKIFSAPKKEEVFLPKPKKVFVPPVFSLEEEIQKLDLLAQQKKWKAFALLATQVLKKELEAKFQKPFAFATGRELEEILQEDLSPQERKDLHRFFALLDPIKFAQKRGQEKIKNEIYSLLRHF